MAKRIAGRVLQISYLKVGINGTAKSSIDVIIGLSFAKFLLLEEDISKLEYKFCYSNFVKKFGIIECLF